ncbi:MAG: PLP-dependent aspartate aminotransferase family protein [Rothia sp. (in: high G+C Gram-positive bacteria)]|uniref:trans-sulfuration enzyme family protein n=1 Tax=Rothia sp. (in: high G+C Gram-positive bacteria) TaxID=1885016 RepID=UPI0026E02347|nr:PLP-dependent aspartate aminotransferase family protein [Rothia sp. (in: high G+C Gram-positive bacteria)]MDO5750483.1 PLP-dependent aspartate aminotransferase family protein [Rothia sp. (in: high G+C Gram-positive bacteria)]
MAGFTTRAIHLTEDNQYGSILPPIFTTTTYAQPLDVEGPYEYQRGGNPSREAAEKTMAALEDAKHAYVYPSGMAATTAALNILKAGETVIMGMPIYGGSYRFATIELAQRNVQTRFVKDFSTLSDADFEGNVTMVFLESPTNPTLEVHDIQHVAEIAHRNGAIVVVDNTFMTPYLQRPLELGADITVQSATKYLGGHADLLAGVAATNNDQLAERLWHNQMVSGSMLSPMDSYRLLQECKTMAIRIDRQQENTYKIIEFLQSHPAVERVLYAGSASEKEAEIHARQAKGVGALISMTLVEGADPKLFLKQLQVFTFAVSLGGIESLVSLPAHMVLGSYSQEHRDMFGIEDRLIRLAIGIEDIDDLIADLKRGLDAISESLA